MRFAPKVFVSRMSAPASTYSRCTASTRGAWVRFIASKLLLMNTPREYSIVPMAPSHTSTRSRRASENGTMGGREPDKLTIWRFNELTIWPYCDSATCDHVSSRSQRNVSASINKYDLLTTSSPIERTPCRTESVNSW